MFAEDVSERKKNLTMKTGADIHKMIQKDQCQFSATTVNPDSKGPTDGPANIDATHMAIGYGRYNIEYISCIDAPPFARQGEPKNPCKKRRKTRAPKLLTAAVGAAMAI
jgi:hypothetical protein